jgi:hypothetical protein
MQKSRFRPKVIRIVLNPEQAVLSCNCYSVGRNDFSGPAMYGRGTVLLACTILRDGSRALRQNNTLGGCGQAYGGLSYTSSNSITSS